MTEAPGANDVPSPDEIRQIIQKAEKGDKKALPALRALLDKCPIRTASHHPVNAIFPSMPTCHLAEDPEPASGVVSP
jgi:hypothetical protein